jgi:hypothetical protein
MPPCRHRCHNDAADDAALPSPCRHRCHNDAADPARISVARARG